MHDTHFWMSVKLLWENSVQKCLKKERKKNVWVKFSSWDTAIYLDLKKIPLFLCYRWTELHLCIDLMHMTSQKGAQARWGSNVALPRAPSPSMQPEGQPLHAIPPGWPGPTHWLRGWAPMRSASTTRARSATSLDPQHGVIVMETWRQCIRSIVPLPC